MLRAITIANASLSARRFNTSVTPSEAFDVIDVMSITGIVILSIKKLYMPVELKRSMAYAIAPLRIRSSLHHLSTASNPFAAPISVRS